MKKTTFILSVLVIVASSSLFAARKNANQKGPGKPQLGQMQDQQGQMMNPSDCTNLTPEEQNFANQCTDMNNKMMFCTQFTPQQRQQAMQMMGQMDASGKMMTADQAVTQVMQNNRMTPMTQQKTRSSGGCPVK